MSAASQRMLALTRGLPSKSEKMRVLAQAGYGRKAIAEFLGTRYQFVRNVLVKDEARKAREAASATASGEAKMGPAKRLASATAIRSSRLSSTGNFIC